MNIKKIVVGIALLAGLWQISVSAYMLSKAWISQYFIKQAWQQTLGDKKQHKPWSWADTYPVARLHIPRLSKDSYVLAGSSGRNLAFSATHLSQSGMPGQEKSVIISGHKDSHFAYLKELVVGDEILLKSIQQGNEKISGYTVYATAIVDSRKHKLKIVNRDELLLTTCYPFDSLSTGGNLRYVVYAMPVI